MGRPLANQEKFWPETVAFRTTVEKKAWLRYMATNEGRSIADIINDLIDEHRDREPTEAQQGLIPIPEGYKEP